MGKWSKEQRAKHKATMDAKRTAKMAMSKAASHDAPKEVPSEAVHYLHGEIRERIRQFAERIDVPVGALTERMGELLRGTTRGKARRA